MADDTENSAAEEKGGKKNLIMFAVVLLVAVGGSVGGTMFFLNDSSAPAEVVETTDNNQPQQAIYYNMRPPYVINYLTGTKPRYLQAEFSIMSRDPEVIEAVIAHMPLIRSEIVGFLTEQNFLELQTQEGKEVVRKGIVGLINNALVQHDMGPGVESALITNFVLQ
ncbi:MAG: flagellar basal body-associated FliL family protein [Pseudomonadota bacterium]